MVRCIVACRIGHCTFQNVTPPHAADAKGQASAFETLGRENGSGPIFDVRSPRLLRSNRPDPRVGAHSLRNAGGSAVGHLPSAVSTRIADCRARPITYPAGAEHWLLSNYTACLVTERHAVNKAHRCCPEAYGGAAQTRVLLIVASSAR